MRVGREINKSVPLLSSMVASNGSFQPSAPAYPDAIGSAVGPSVPHAAARCPDTKLASVSPHRARNPARLKIFAVSLGKNRFTQNNEICGQALTRDLFVAFKLLPPDW